MINQPKLGGFKQKLFSLMSVARQLWLCWSWLGWARLGSRPWVWLKFTPWVSHSSATSRPDRASSFHEVRRGTRGQAQPHTLKTLACITSANIPLTKASHTAKPKVKRLFPNVIHNAKTQRTYKQPYERAHYPERQSTKEDSNGQ